MAKITADEIKLLAQYISNISGIYLDQDKGYLLETRLNPLLAAHRCDSFMALYHKARSNASRSLDKEIINAISTNETLFFRDSKPFELLKNKIIPDLVDHRSAASGQGKIKLRIWSAACSTGQEVYSIAISLLETLGDLSDYDITLLGTDISDEAIAKASYGLYGKFEIERGLPKNILQRYFTPSAGGWRVKDQIRSLVVFRKFNLMDSYSALGSFDVIFCRNVAIYFTDADKRKLFQKLAQVLADDGCLIIGGSESLGNIAPQFRARNYLRGVYYQLQGAEEAVKKLRKPATAGAGRAARKAAVKTPAKRKNSRQSPPKVEKKAARLQGNNLPPIPSPTEKLPDPPVSVENERSDNDISVPEVSGMPANGDSCSAASFLEAVESREQSGASLLDSLPAARQSGKPLIIGGGREADSEQGAKSSLLQSIAERHQDGNENLEQE